MKIKTAHPRLYFDGNSALEERSFAIVQGMLEDLHNLGLTPSSALGSHFTFVQEDIGPAGNADALFFTGTIAFGQQLGYFALADSNGVRWLSEVTSDDA